jgi:hypothetical protein
MPTIRLHREHQRVSAGRVAIMPVKPGRVARLPLWLVKPRMSAIEHIVETARPGEVIHVDDGDYYNAHLWRNYNCFITR